MDLQDEVNQMLSDIIEMSATTAEIAQHMDNMIADPTPLTHEEEVALLTTLKARLFQMQETINDSADIMAALIGAMTAKK